MSNSTPSSSPTTPTTPTLPAAGSPPARLLTAARPARALHGPPAQHRPEVASDQLMLIKRSDYNRMLKLAREVTAKAPNFPPPAPLAQKPSVTELMDLLEQVVPTFYGHPTPTAAAAPPRAVGEALSAAGLAKLNAKTKRATPRTGSIGLDVASWLGGLPSDLSAPPQQQTLVLVSASPTQSTFAPNSQDAASPIAVSATPANSPATPLAPWSTESVNSSAPLASPPSSPTRSSPVVPKSAQAVLTAAAATGDPNAVDTLLSRAASISSFLARLPEYQSPAAKAGSLSVCTITGPEDEAKFDQATRKLMLDHAPESLDATVRELRDLSGLDGTGMATAGAVTPVVAAARY
ncbi:hypothetical protein H9P43_006291 [Blastocladiella emersonii ATCC 22665]|nr:hypothetical protein H9P43_006291 [Blastocladiella emersonii ATCC 22665]